ncbi:hypothetical protein EJB05_12730, partial [Eragrostis curvula]
MSASPHLLFFASLSRSLILFGYIPADLRRGMDWRDELRAGSYLLSVYYKILEVRDYNVTILQHKHEERMSG